MIVDIELTCPTTAFDFGLKVATDMPRSYSTGIPLWDAICDTTSGEGLAEGWYIVLGGASNSGKTRLALHLLREIAKQAGNPGLISLETPAASIQRMWYSQITSFGYHDFTPDRFGVNFEAKATRLKKEVDDFRSAHPTMHANAYVREHKRRATLGTIVRDAEELAELGCKAIMVDHLQLVKATGGLGIAEAATEVSECLREIAHDKGILIIGLSQLNRGASRNKAEAPTMYDLWGGTSMESNADQVVLIDHGRSEAKVTAPAEIMTYLLVDKNRHGPAKTEIPVTNDIKRGSFHEAPADHAAKMWPTRKG